MLNELVSEMWGGRGRRLRRPLKADTSGGQAKMLDPRPPFKRSHLWKHNIRTTQPPVALDEFLATRNSRRERRDMVRDAERNQSTQSADLDAVLRAVSRSPGRTSAPAPPVQFVAPLRPPPNEPELSAPIERLAVCLPESPCW